MATRRTIRELSGSKGDITDLCFSNDGRWVIAASSDSVVRVWDLPTGHLIDAVRLRSTCRALAFSNTGEFLALAQDDSVGVDIWTNSTLFKRIPTKKIAEHDIAEVEGPAVSGEGGTSAIESAMEQEAQEEESEYDGVLAPVEQLSKDVMTLSLVPKSRWQTLLHLDLIRARNKPKEPPKAPEKAPFFLPSLRQETKPQINGPTPTDALQEANLEAERSRIIRMDRAGGESDFTKLLRQRALLDLTNLLKTLPPSAADVEIRSLSPLAPYTEMVNFLEALIERLEARRDYELVQAWMAVFLKCHGEVLQEALPTEDGSALLDALKRWRSGQQKEAARLGSLAGYCSGVVGFLRTSR